MIMDMSDGYVYTFYVDYELFILLAHPICLCLVMIVSFDTRKQMMSQVELVRFRVGEGLAGELLYGLFSFTLL